MSRISAADAFLVLANWREERTAIQVVMSRSVRQRATSPAVINEVLPHSQKILLTLRDEHGVDVGVTVSLEGAEWEHADAGKAYSLQQDKIAGAVLPEFAAMRRVCWLAATFPNGNRYVFGEKAESDEG